MSDTNTIRVDFTEARALGPADLAVYSAAELAWQIAHRLRDLRPSQTSHAAASHLAAAANEFDDLADELLDLLGADPLDAAPGHQLAKAIEQAFQLLKSGQSPDRARLVLQRALASYRSWLEALSVVPDRVPALECAAGALTAALAAITQLPVSSDCAVLGRCNSSEQRVHTLLAAPGAPPVVPAHFAGTRAGGDLVVQMS
jgi:hypothetical protein